MADCGDQPTQRQYSRCWAPIAAIAVLLATEIGPACGRGADGLGGDVDADGGTGPDGGEDAGISEDADADSGVSEDAAIGSGVDPSDAVFDVLAIHQIALTMEPDDWADIRDDPWAGTWHRATFGWDDESVEDVGVRAFGYGSRVEGKPPLKISFDHFEGGHEWRGLEQLKLDNSAQDPTFLNERLCNGIMRRFGVPAVRTGWAIVTVNGEHVGFFIVLEPVDDRFLERNFRNADGALYDTVQGAWGRGLNPIDDPLGYYNPQTSLETDGSDLHDLAEVIAYGSDEELEAAVDLEGFWKESIARSVMGSVDSFSADGNNFYLYNDGGLWRIITWDMDYDLATNGVEAALAVDPREPWASSPWATDSFTGEPYTDPVLLRQIARGRDVEATVAELIGGAMEHSLLDREITDSVELIRQAVTADPLGDGDGYDDRIAELRRFLSMRLLP